MTELISDGLFLPALILAALGFVVPRLFALVLPEGVKPLMLNAFLSTVLLIILSALFFVALYLWQGAPLEEITATGRTTAVVVFGQLGLAAAIIWAPIMLLSVAGLPRKWVKETW